MWTRIVMALALAGCMDNAAVSPRGPRDGAIGTDGAAEVSDDARTPLPSEPSVAMTDDTPSCVQLERRGRHGDDDGDDDDDDDHDDDDDDDDDVVQGTPDASVPDASSSPDAMVGCVAPDPPVDAPSFLDVYPSLRACADCHDAGGSGGLDLSSQAVAYANLVDVPARAGGPCDGSVRVVPGDPDASVLYRKLAGTMLCGARMPRGEAAWTDAKIALIAAWIEAGAAP